MGKTPKKRDATAAERRSNRSSEPEANDRSWLLRPADPPKRHPRLLLLSIVLLAIWSIFLIYVALTSSR